MTEEEVGGNMDGQPSSVVVDKYVFPLILFRPMHHFMVLQTFVPLLAGLMMFSICARHSRQHHSQPPAASPSMFP